MRSISRANKHFTAILTGKFTLALQKFSQGKPPEANAAGYLPDGKKTAVCRREIKILYPRLTDRYFSTCI
jgi:hypothetical protein